MLRYRKLWVIVSGVVLILMLIMAVLKPDIVTVVPTENQLDSGKPDLQLEEDSVISEETPSEPDHTESIDTSKNNVK